MGDHRSGYKRCTVTTATSVVTALTDRSPIEQTLPVGLLSSDPGSISFLAAARYPYLALKIPPLCPSYYNSRLLSLSPSHRELASPNLIAIMGVFSSVLLIAALSGRILLASLEKWTIPGQIQNNRP